eukprot:TRINITY_DN289_c0_g2_i1.p2 TRINITY_DN289_c0_g2~~TRINITY_DN289_c0_g2_i1.p2  ORF type:complete len:152 (-),score=23.97 TRINITY_DN289_c0_g2_i1:473-928(-)
MGSLLPGWDQVSARNFPVINEVLLEDEQEHVPWWLKGNKEVTHLQDTIQRERRASFEIPPTLDQTSAQRRSSFERRRSFDNMENGAKEVFDQEVGDQSLSWWNRLMTSTLNEKPDVDLNDYKTGSYLPQFGVAGDFAYHMNGEKESLTSKN